MTEQELQRLCLDVAERFRREHYGELIDNTVHLLVAEMVAACLAVKLEEKP